MTNLDKVYDPQTVEPQMYALWERCGAFRSTPAGTPHERTFTIVIPPPNVTGALHLGHALTNILQDILIRYHRMRGFNTLWQPGTDHAGIATQAVVERRIREQEGKTRHDLGREELVKRIWQWKDQYEERILSQLKLMGCSCDWERSRFTLDEGLARAVRQQFFRMFKDGLIFRGKRLVNWDTQLQTAVADDEVYHETVKGHFWHFRYPVIDPQAGEPDVVIIATTRPETMLGDTAVAVHPDPDGFFAEHEARLRGSISGSSGKERAELDGKLETLLARRASHLSHLMVLREMARAGRKIRLPLVEREIPLITDEWADPTLGSGCVKITPAHDPNDYEVAARHGLPMINVLTAEGKIARIVEPDGSTNPNSAVYEGLTFSADGRAKVVADMQARGLVEATEDRDVELGHSDRSNVPVEPYLSDQWFVKTGDVKSESLKLGDGSSTTGLAQAAMDAVVDGRIQIFPSRYAKSYLDWLCEKRDWCISRQLWWGHRIPIWSNDGAIAGWGDSVDEFSSNLKVWIDEGRISVYRREKEDFGAEGHDALLGGSPLFFICVRNENDAEVVSKLKKFDFTQDPDVLDTWFSSALWPFSTLGWPDQTEHLKQYYPTTVLVTSRDIITNWVARMVMFGLYAIGKVPFDRVYITPKVLDGRGETMSKSKGNGVDPADIIKTYGADALRYSIADMASETQDVRMPVDYLCPACGGLTDQTVALKAETQARRSRGEKLDRKIQPADCARVSCTHCKKPFATRWADNALQQELGVAPETSERFEVGRNFANKLWNAARFSFMNLEATPRHNLDIPSLPPEDRWILAKLSGTIRRYHGMIQQYQFSASVKELRDFFWDSLCDWYIELAKPRLGDDQGNVTAAAAKQILAFCLDQTLRLWHPTIPFITERLWRQLNEIVPKRGLPGIAELLSDSELVTAAFPPVAGYPVLEDDHLLKVFAEIQDAVRGVRDLRASCGVSPKEQVMVTVVLPKTDVGAFKANAHIIRRMANVAELHVDPNAKRPPNAGSVSVGSLRIYVHDISDDKAERARTNKALADLQAQIAGTESKLSNEGFLANAKPAIVAGERERLATLLSRRSALQTHLAELDGLPS